MLSKLYGLAHSSEHDTIKSKRMFDKSDTDPYVKTASDFVYFLKKGNLTRKAIRDVLCTKSGRSSGKSHKKTGLGCKRKVISVKRGISSSRRVRLSVRKDRLPARKTILSARTIRKLHQQNPAAARLIMMRTI